MTPEEKLKILDSFSTAHRSKEAGKTSPQFSKNVMRRIRNLDQENELTDGVAYFQPVIWRIASSTAFLAIALFAYTVQTGFLPEYEVAEIFMENADILLELPLNRQNLQ